MIFRYQAFRCESDTRETKEGGKKSAKKPTKTEIYNQWKNNEQSRTKKRIPASQRATQSPIEANVEQIDVCTVINLSENWTRRDIDVAVAQFIYIVFGIIYTGALNEMFSSAILSIGFSCFFFLLLMSSFSLLFFLSLKVYTDDNNNEELAKTKITKTK